LVNEILPHVAKIVNLMMNMQQSVYPHAWHSYSSTFYKLVAPSRSIDLATPNYIQGISQFQSPYSVLLDDLRYSIH